MAYVLVFLATLACVILVQPTSGVFFSQRLRVIFNGYARDE